MASVSPKRSPLQKKKSKDECKDACMNAINNNVLRASPRRQAVLFAEWYRQLVDQDRSSLCLYFSDNAVLQWFGRTIKTKKKISDFLKYDLNCSSHRFSAVEVCPPIIMYFRPSTEVLATPLDSDTPSGILNAGIQRVSLRSVVKRTRSPFSSPDSPGAIASKKWVLTRIRC